MNRCKLKATGLCLVILFLCLVQGRISQAGEPELLPIRSVPEVPLQTPAERLDFSGGGTIQRIGQDDDGKKLIVIDDRLLYFAQGATFHDQQGNLIAELKFKEGGFVGYFLNAKRQIIRLYLINR